MEHMKRPIRPPSQPDQKVVPPRQEEEDGHIPQRQHARTVRDQLAPVDLQRSITATDNQENDVDEPVACYQQRLHSSRKRVPPDWLSVASPEQRRVHQPSFEGVGERTWWVYCFCGYTLGFGVGGEADAGVADGGPDGADEADGEKEGGEYVEVEAGVVLVLYYH